MQRNIPAMNIAQGEPETRQLACFQRYVVEWVLQLVVNHGTKPGIHDDAPKYVATPGSKTIVVIAKTKIVYQI